MIGVSTEKWKRSHCIRWRETNVQTIEIKCNDEDGDSNNKFANKIGEKKRKKRANERMYLIYGAEI